MPSPMNVLAILAHPSPKSLNRALLDTLAEGLRESGHTVRINDLYESGFNPVLTSEDLSAAKNGSGAEDILREQELLRWAEGLVLVYPIWWHAMPAVLKGWIDRVFQFGFAFRSDSNGVQGLLTHRKALILATAGNTEDEMQDALDSVIRPISEGTLKYCGIQNVQTRIFYSTAKMNDDARARIFAETRDLGLRF